MTIKLVTFQEPIFPTLQGEGTLAGTPSTFIRLYGCDFSCSWCDTKDSWREGSVGREWSIDDIVTHVQSLRRRHLVITGGNPLLQADELAEFFSKLGYGYHITIETQGSVVPPKDFCSHVELMSLSPKLVRWTEEELFEIIEQCLYWDTKVQVKLVVTRAPGEDLEAAISAINHMLQRYQEVTYIIQPETSLGKGFMRTVNEDLDEWLSGPECPNYVFDLRVIPQLHKSALLVP